MEKPLLLLDYSWLESKNGRLFVVLGRWFGKDTEEVELLEYPSRKPVRRPASELKKLIDEGTFKIKD